ncbi:MAG: YhdP family protein, partial [Janthinobacterium lividum]
MSTNQNSPSKSSAHGDMDPPAMRGFWPGLCRGCRVAGQGCKRVLGLLGIAALLGYFAFCGLVLVLRYAVLPQIDRYKPRIEEAASHALGLPVTIATVQASWRGLAPHLVLGDVRVLDHDGAPALRLPKVAATLSWLSVPLAGLRLQALDIDRPELFVARNTAGHVLVAGIDLEDPRHKDGGGLDWVLSQREIRIRDGVLHWDDARRNAAPLTLRSVNLLMQNSWNSHRLGLRLTPPAAFGAPVDLRASFNSPVFAQRSADFHQWRGRFYADVGRTDLAAWKPYFDYPFELTQGSGALRAWLSFDHMALKDVTADLQLARLSARLQPELEPLAITQLAGRVTMRDTAAPATSPRTSITAAGTAGRPTIAAPASTTTAKVVAAVSSANGAAAAASASGPGTVESGADTTPATTAANAVEAPGWKTFGQNGYALALSGFSLESADGKKLPAIDASFSFLPATGGRQASSSFSASSLDLCTLADFATRLPLSSSQRQMISDHAPRGVLSGLSASWSGTYPAISAYAIKTRFAGLGMLAQPPHPARPKSATLPAMAATPAMAGFENLSGSIDADERRGKLALDSSAATLQLPGYLTEPSLALDRLAAQVKWSVDARNNRVLELDDLRLASGDMHLAMSARQVMPMAASKEGEADRTHRKSAGSLKVSARLDHFDVSHLERYLPLQTPPHLRDWLSGALVSGQARDVALEIDGDPANFPFHANANAAGQPVQPGGTTASTPGRFTVSGKIDNGVLNYLPGHTGADGHAPLWPLLVAINGSFAVDRTRLHIHADSAQTNAAALSKVDAVIADLATEDRILEITGSAAGALQNFLGYTVESPVAGWIGHFTEESRAGGNASLELKLQIPLARAHESRVNGVLKFAGNDVTLQKLLPPLTQTGGELAFNEHGFELTGIRSTFLGGAVAITGGTQRDGSIAIRAEGAISADGLRRNFAAPGMLKLLQRINGSTRYVATINVRNKRPEVQVESNLVGLALDFPAPLQKSMAENMPLKFDMHDIASEDVTVLRDEFNLSLGTAVAARYARKKALGQDAGWMVERAGIGVNVPVPQPESGLTANVSLKTLDIDAWRSSLGLSGAAMASSAAVADPAGQGAQSAAPAAPELDQLGLAQYIEPEVLAARATELIIMGKQLNHVVVGASHQDTLWQANIDSDEASGYVSWSEPRHGRGLGVATARLATLSIPKSATDEVSTLLKGTNATMEMPGLDIVAEHFELGGKQLGKLELLASNSSAATGREWRISKLALSNSDGVLHASGKWANPGPDSITALDYTLEISDAGKLLERFGFGRVVHGGKGIMAGELNWNGLPFSLDLPSLSGEVKLDLSSGQFLKVDPAAAKLLGVLNLQSLPRRLALDFRDVFSEGFAFDGVLASANIDQGIMSTENFKMRSVAAVVLMNGSVDIARESQDLHVVVLPEVNVGAASVVYGLMVNPVIGLGTFLAQLFLRDPLMQAFTMEYQV